MILLLQAFYSERDLHSALSTSEGNGASKKKKNSWRRLGRNCPGGEQSTSSGGEERAACANLRPSTRSYELTAYKMLSYRSHPVLGLLYRVMVLSILAAPFYSS